jgi:hypothetical protein
LVSWQAVRVCEWWWWVVRREPGDEVELDESWNGGTGQRPVVR